MDAEYLPGFAYIEKYDKETPPMRSEYIKYARLENFSIAQQK